ncbi:hypothetical protein [Zoogloea sp.]|uniref:hypothetical protein n=1 Tax=Zoogloea sp. TaxID=49181 RepID=UPI0025FDA485|nr:hypothetical protein [Zoogloea sp.]MCK6393122.1 hypothetical protein [Zoogloea sp.]
MSIRPLHAVALALGVLVSLPVSAESPTLHWPLPLPAGHPWRIVDLREGNGIRHEEYIPRGQGIEDYRDRIVVQRMASQNLNPETYLAHVSAGLRAHCSELTTSGLFASERDGLPSAALTVYCARFASRSYGYVVAQKAVLDGEHLFVVEREWRLPAFSIDATGLPQFDPGSTGGDENIGKEIRLAVRWLVEQVQPGTEIAAPAPPPPPAPRSKRRP